VTAELLQVINSSPGESRAALRCGAQKGTRLCQATFGVQRAYDGKVLHTVPALGDTRRPAAARKHTVPRKSVASGGNGRETAAGTLLRLLRRAETGVATGPTRAIRE
jgi:hypothetical protein